MGLIDGLCPHRVSIASQESNPGPLCHAARHVADTFFEIVTLGNLELNNIPLKEFNMF